MLETLLLVGTQTAGLYAGGYVTAAVANVETYDGTSWSETTDISTARYSLNSSNNSPQTSGILGGDAALVEQMLQSLGMDLVGQLDLLWAVPVADEEREQLLIL